MLLIWKNKGLLVLLYLLVCFIGTAMIAGALHRNFSGPVSNIDFYTIAGTSFLFASIWTYATKDSFYKDKNGERKKMDTVNEFFWINMKTWAIIFFAAAVLFFGNGLFHYLG